VCHCHATTSSFVAKVRGKVFTYFHVVAITCQSSMWNWLFGLTWLILSSPNAYLIIAKVSVARFARYEQNQTHREIASVQIHDSK
jgi:hypothetical protein